MRKSVRVLFLLYLGLGVAWSQPDIVLDSLAVNEVRLGMDANQVDEILGPPRTTRERPGFRRYGKTGDVLVIFRPDLDKVVLVSGRCLLLEGEVILRHGDPIGAAREALGEPSSSFVDDGEVHLIFAASHDRLECTITAKSGLVSTIQISSPREIEEGLRVH